MKTRKTFQLLGATLVCVSFLFASNATAQDKPVYCDVKRPNNIGVANFDNFKNSSFDVCYNIGKLDVNLAKVEENLISYKKDPENFKIESLRADIKSLRKINEAVPKLKSELKQLKGQGEKLVKEAKNVRPRTKAPAAGKITKKSITALDKSKEKMGTLVERQKIALATATELLGNNE